MDTIASRVLNSPTASPSAQLLEILKRLSVPAIPVEEAGEVLGVSRGSAYKGVASGDIPSYRIGRKIMVPTAPLKRMLGLEPEVAA